MREIKPDGTGNFTVERIGWVAIFVEQSIGTGIEAITGDRGEPTMVNLGAIAPGQQLLLPAAGRPDHEHIVIKNVAGGTHNFSIEQIIFDGTVYRNYGGSKVMPAENPPAFEIFEMGPRVWKLPEVLQNEAGTSKTFANGDANKVTDFSSTSTATFDVPDTIGTDGDVMVFINNGAGAKTFRTARTNNAEFAELAEGDYVVLVKDADKWRTYDSTTDKMTGNLILRAAGTSVKLPSNFATDWKWLAFSANKTTGGAGQIPVVVPTLALKSDDFTGADNQFRINGGSRASWMHSTRVLTGGVFNYVYLMN